MSASAHIPPRQPDQRLICWALAAVLTLAPLLTCCFNTASHPGHESAGAHVMQGMSNSDTRTGSPHAAAVDPAPSYPAASYPSPEHDDDCRCPPCVAATHSAPQVTAGPEPAAEWDTEIDAVADPRSGRRRARTRPPATGPPPTAILAAVTPYDLHDRQLD